MLYVKKSETPKTLKYKSKIYKKEAKKLKLWNGEKSKLYKFYKNNKQKLGINYSDHKIKKALLNSTNNRCCICGRIIIDSNKATDEDIVHTVEHIVPQTENPQKILSWNNLIPVCIRCNSVRGDKKVQKPFKFLNPRRHKKIYRNFYYLYNGMIKGVNLNYEEMIKIYKLNSLDKEYSLLNERQEFYFQVLNPLFDKMIQLEGEPVEKSKAIVFLDLYLNKKEERKE